MFGKYTSFIKSNCSKICSILMVYFALMNRDVSKRPGHKSGGEIGGECMWQGLCEGGVVEI